MATLEKVKVILFFRKSKKKRRREHFLPLQYNYCPLRETQELQESLNELLVRNWKLDRLHQVSWALLQSRVWSEKQTITVLNHSMFKPEVFKRHKKTLDCFTKPSIRLSTLLKCSPHWTWPRNLNLIKLNEPMKSQKWTLHCSASTVTVLNF